MLTAISQFFLSEWLWAFTRGGYHAPINIFVMIALCIFILRQKTVPAVLLSVSANLFAFFVFMGIGYFLKVDFVPEHDNTYVIQSLLVSCFSLGVIYATLQTLYIMLLRTMFSMNVPPLIIMAWISNIITAWIMFRALPL